VERIEDKGGFACAAEAGDHHETTEGEVEVETLQVMLADTAQPDAFSGGSGSGRGGGHARSKRAAPPKAIAAKN
jgi:hypothetical protein